MVCMGVSRWREFIFPPEDIVTYSQWFDMFDIHILKIYEDRACRYWLMESAAVI